MAVTTITHAADAALTITNWSTGLAAGQFALSSVVDNDSDAYVDVLVGGEIAFNTDTGTIVAGDSYDIYALAQYSDTATDIGGAIAALMGWGNEEAEDTAFIKANLKNLICSISPQATTPDTTEDAHWGPIALAQFFGGVMPKDWGLMLHNNTTDSTLGAGSTANFIGITYTTA